MKRTVLLFTAFLLAACAANEPAPVPSAPAETTPAVTADSAEDVMRTAYFDLRINDAALLDEHEGALPEEGTRFLLLDVTVTNTGVSDIAMYDTDFQVFWGEEEDAWTVPVTSAHPGRVYGHLLPREYVLQAGNERSGRLLYEVAEEASAFGLSFLERFAEERMGEVSVIYFEGDPN